MTTGARASRSMPLVGRGVLIGLTIAGLLLAAVMASLAGVVFFAAYAGLGAYLTIRRPRNSVGWWLMTMGWGLAIGSAQPAVPLDTLLAGQLAPYEAVSAWASGCGWGIALVAFYGIALVFPSGRLPDTRGRWPSRIGLGAIIALAGLIAVRPTINVNPAQTGVPVDIPNPVALVPDASFWMFVPEPTLLYGTMFALVASGVVALILRSRRSVGLERLQYRWLVAAIAFAAVANLIWAVAGVALRFDASGAPWLLVLVAYPTIPIAIVVAVLRHRLYEIDRIISRTIAYAGVSVILAGVFGVGVLILSFALASLAEGQTIAVAGSTLATYAALQPVLRRVRRDVDRRFDRARYDAEQTVLAFADRLRSEIDVEAVTTDLAMTARSTVAPVSTSLWLRSRDASR
jgi:hypothetical protein